MLQPEARGSGGLEREADRSALPAKKKSLHDRADSFVALRLAYQTLFPQTLFPNNAMNVTIHPRFESTMYFIMVQPPVIPFSLAFV
jgi:hypothetical protein